MGRLKNDAMVYERDDDFDPADYYDDPHKCEHCGDQVAEPGLCYVCHRDAEIEWMAEVARKESNERMTP